MKKTYFFTVAFLMLTFSILGQTKKRIIVNEKEEVYLSLKDKGSKITTDTSKPDGFKLLKDKQILITKDQDINVFSKWLNPLVHDIVVKDSFYIDSRSKIIQEYRQKVLDQFNAPLTGSLPNPAFAIVSCTPAGFSFSREDVLEIFEYGKQFLTGTSDSFCDAFKNLYNVENQKIADKTGKISKLRSMLIAISDYRKVDSIIKIVESDIKDISNSYKKDYYTLIGLELAISDRQVASKPLLYKKLKNFYEKEFAALEASKNQVLKLTEYIAMLKKSVEKDSESKEYEGYFLIHTIEIPEDKEGTTYIKKTNKKFDKQKSEFVEDSSKDFEFNVKLYDWVTPKVGTGLFYASTNLNSFGVSTNDEGQLVVSEDNIEKNTAATALMLNLNFDISSRYFAPLVQLGIDPTKERPFLLFGGGFSIPSSNFAITGGLIWTWEASLEELSLGDVVESSTEVEESINHDFRIEPKGYYLGLTYNF